MERNRIQTIIDIAIIFLVSLIPFLWLTGGYIILGHDAGTPITPDAHFLDRLSTWTQRYGLGDNQTFAVPGFFLHGLEYVLSFLPVSLSLQQIISFVIYFFLMGGSMYLFARVLFPKYNYLPLFAGIFYQVNHFVLQAWFVAERTKFTTYIDLPLILLYQYYFLFKKRNALLAAVMTSFTIWILNGGGFIPLFGAILIIQPIFTVFLFLQSEKKIQFLKQFAIYIGLTTILSIGLHSYWLLPYYSYISSSFSNEIVKAGGIDGVINWVSSISLHTSFLNEFRLQGIQEWYVNPFHPYSRTYLENPIFIVLSFLIPLAAFGALLIKKEKNEQKLLLLFGLMALISMIFMAGSHPPFGELYILLLKKIPGFIAFRTPFYKFAPGLWLCYAILLGYTIEFLWRKITLPTIILKGLIAVLIIGYTYPILSPAFFDYYEDRTTRVKVPDYVSSYADWSNSENFSYRRLLVMPPISSETNAHITDWGYWSLASVHSLLDRNSYVNRGSSYLPNEKKLIDELYSAFENQDSNWKNIAKVLNIDGIVLYEDVPPYKEGKTITPKLYKDLINKDPSIKKDQQFGKWTVYKISEKKQPLKLVSTYYHYIDNRSSTIDPIFNVPFDLSESIYLTNDNTINSLQLGNVSVANCVHCTLIDVPFPRGSTDIRVLPGSNLFQWKLQDEQVKRTELTNINERIPFELELSWKRLNEIERLIVSNADSNKKTLAWKYYSEQQDNLSAALRMIDTKIFNATNNQLLMLSFDTVKLQNSMLLDRIKDITGDINEGRNYLDSMNKSNAIYASLDKLVHYTTDISNKKMVASIPVEGTYTIFMKNDLATTENSSQNTVSLELLDTTYETTITDDEWIKLGAGNFQKGEFAYNLSIPEEVQNKSPFSNTSFQFDQFNNCRKVTLGELVPGTYSFQTSATSENNIKASLFIINEDFENPLLPYWGDTYTLSQENNEIKKTFVVENKQIYNLNLCIYESVKKQIIKFNDTSIYQISNPTVIFVKENTPPKITQERTLTINNQTQATYDVTISPGNKTILTLDQRYNNLWSISIPESEHILVNNYSNGWTIPASDEPIKAQIYFTPEKQLKTGWSITISTIAGILIITGIYFVIKR